MALIRYAVNDPDEGPLIMEIEREDLSVEDQQTLDSYLDAVEYYLDGEAHPGRTSIFDILDLTGANIGGYDLETNPGILAELASAGEIDPSEDHSL